MPTKVTLALPAEAAEKLVNADPEHLQAYMKEHGFEMTGKVAYAEEPKLLVLITRKTLELALSALFKNWDSQPHREAIAELTTQLKLNMEPNTETKPDTLKLTSANVREVFFSCLFQEGEPTESHVLAEGVRAKIGFHPERLAANKEKIQQLLRQLPDEFHEEKGGGMSFLQACMTRDGEQWGEHQNIDELLVLGLASGQAKYMFSDRSMWSVFPGGMPYFSVS
jgi:hypothetical protein